MECEKILRIKHKEVFGKVVILSSTLETHTIKEAFPNCKVGSVVLSGRQHQLHERLLRPRATLTDPQYLQVLVKMIMHCKKEGGDGSILVFVESRGACSFFLS